MSFDQSRLTDNIMNGEKINPKSTLNILDFLHQTMSAEVDMMHCYDGFHKRDVKSVNFTQVASLRCFLETIYFCFFSSNVFS